MKHGLWKLLSAALMSAAALGAPLGAAAQDAGKAARDLELYQGADRHDKLVELAKKEGEL